jgi:monoterpene epsilon-lactone hydrolase
MSDAKPSPAPALTTQGPGHHVPARFIPVPKTISPEAQAVLTQPNPYGGGTEPDPTDKAAWEKRSREGNEAFTQMLASRFASDQPKKLVEHKLVHSTLYEIEPTSLPVQHAAKALFYVHGGGFTLGGGSGAAYAALELARLAGLRTFSIDYRMPPQSPFPAGLDDSVEAYRFVLDRFEASNVAAYGPSAGGAMAASCLLKARDLGMPMPAACVLHSPEADLTESGDSFETNLGIDPVLKRLTNSIALYANGHDLRDPYLSPLFGDFSKGFPPTMLSAGTRDLFLSNTVLMHRALKSAGIPATLSIWEAMGHAGFFGAAPEDRAVLQEHVQFILDHLIAR